ncbi:hypothetical protein RHMOL_Rhmol11G0007600 [Rhododendron molle]|uniref:Uncharacterized protein n=1 Tax=Rhododendron molle TaxID=49168 RepID=A0ACC0LNM7_RHOML|nr:hypothetical protein RHMOL_Rhmol11G0007600 [Rhododendron molle]
MKSSGVLVDCSELKSQLNRLKEHNDISRYQSSSSDACGNPQTLNVNFKIPSGSKIGQGEFINLESDLKAGILSNPIEPRTNRFHNPIRPQGESSSIKSAIEDSNGIPNVAADLPNSDELQPITTSESLPIVVFEIVVKDSRDKGIVGKGPVVAAGPRSSSTSIDTSVIQAPGDELSDSEDELLEVLERVVSTNQESETLEAKGVQPQAGIKPPETPDLLGPGDKRRAAEQVPTDGLVIDKTLTKSAQKRLRKLAKEQSLCSLSSGGT